mmetsp:Transcript_1574/g.3430  ORF Transcript_1574/g.3430 Transcript_1574/m.3430 type:complete len:202 (-) Transcript_1574:130-735(-)
MAMPLKGDVSTSLPDQELLVNCHPPLDELHPVATGIQSKGEATHFPLIRLLEEGHAQVFHLLAHGVKVVHQEADVPKPLRITVASMYFKRLILLSAMIMGQFQHWLPKPLHKGFRLWGVLFCGHCCFFLIIQTCKEEVGEVARDCHLSAERHTHDVPVELDCLLSILHAHHRLRQVKRFLEHANITRDDFNPVAIGIQCKS